MTKYESIKEPLESQNEYMRRIKDTYVVNDFETILYNEIEENNICLGITAITEDNIVYRGIANGNDFSYITQILDSIPRITNLDFVCCSIDRFENEDDKKEVLTLLTDTFNKYKPNSIELKQSHYIMIDPSGKINYENNEIYQNNDNKFK